MILPDKNITLANSLIGLGSKIIVELSTPQTVSSLWEKVRKKYLEIRTFERFVLTLDLLYIMGLIELEDGIIKRQMK
ncbi:MAG: hypothetical protein C4560_11010 [Nitrospiraceae bacterium]|nr:MAG: hypothetical protein C4560_11010 [Nitrospiraceae bacterium]